MAFCNTCTHWDDVIGYLCDPGQGHCLFLETNKSKPRYLEAWPECFHDGAAVDFITTGHTFGCIKHKPK